MSISPTTVMTQPVANNIHPATADDSSKKPSRIIQKIWSAVKFIFKAALGLLFYWSNPILFALGFMAGIVADDKVAKLVKKIGIIWDNQSTAICALTIFGAYMSLPVTFAAGSFLYAANMASKLSHEAHALHAQKQVTSLGDKLEKLVASAID